MPTTVLIVNKRQVRLEFEVGKFGPSGLGSVDVYVTTDEGQTWEKSKIDVGTNMPLVPDARSGAAVRGSVMVPLEREQTIYGFYIVVKNRAGHGKPAPERNTLPQIRVEADLTPPEARLFGPQPDPTKRDTLLLSWDASDRNLAPTPISLEWAPKKDGPWSHIGADMLENTGKFAWTVPANIPPNVYLRLSVRDKAGNVSVAETKDPVLIDFSEPEVLNIGLEKISR